MLIKGLMRRTAEDVIEIGNALIRQRKAMPGLFMAWIDLEFSMSERSAYRFINVAAVYGDKPGTVPGLNLKALYELAAPSTPPEVRDEIERRIASGEVVSATEVKQLKRRTSGNFFRKNSGGSHPPKNSPAFEGERVLNNREDPNQCEVAAVCTGPSPGSSELVVVRGAGRWWCYCSTRQIVASPHWYACASAAIVSPLP